MTQRVFIPGPLPGMNDLSGRKSRWHYHNLRKNWQATIGLFIGKAKLQPMQCAAVTFRWAEKNRKRDPDNIISGQKFVLDALVESGILPDDGQDEISALRHEFTVDKANPGVWVELEGV